MNKHKFGTLWESSLPNPSSVLLLAGPTAVGKSELALSLAERLGGEIISVDSMQVYRGLDIGTAKPSMEERAGVQHHLIDIVPLTESFDAVQFAWRAKQAVSEIQARGRVPILCGGTGLYFKAFLEGLGQSPPGDAALRAQLKRTPLPELLRELEERDLECFQRIDRKNPRRVVRAIEVIRLTGKTFSEQRSAWGSGKAAKACYSVGLFRSREDLKRRINERVEAMFQRGLVAETEHLLKQGLEQNKTAMQALGYRQVVEHLRGHRTLAETVGLVKSRTRQFAKRQMTWFRRQLSLEWIGVAENQSAESVAELVLGKVSIIED